MTGQQDGPVQEGLEGLPALKSIYLKKLLFRGGAPWDAQHSKPFQMVFTSKQEFAEVTEGLGEILMTMGVSLVSDLDDEEPLLQIEAQVACLLQIEGSLAALREAVELDAGQTEPSVGQHFASVLYPYGRDAIESTLVKTGVSGLMPASLEAFQENAEDDSEDVGDSDFDDGDGSIIH